VRYHRVEDFRALFGAPEGPNIDQLLMMLCTVLPSDLPTVLDYCAGRRFVPSLVRASRFVDGDFERAARVGGFLVLVSRVDDQVEVRLFSGQIEDAPPVARRKFAESISTGTTRVAERLSDAVAVADGPIEPFDRLVFVDDGRVRTAMSHERAQARYVPRMHPGQTRPASAIAGDHIEVRLL